MDQWQIKPIANSPGFRLFEVNSPTRKSWLAIADLQVMDLEARIAGPNLRLPTSKQSDGCRLAVNGGYFDPRTCTSSSLFIQNGIILGFDEQNIRRRNGKVGNPARAAIGLTPDGWSIRWTRSSDDTPYSFPEATDPWQIPQGGNVWNALNAVGGGPMLLVDGKAKITAENELFDRESGVDPEGRHGRTAIGLDNQGWVYIYVVDGKRRDAIGASMTELASIFSEFGAKNAMNLDGGGSSTIVYEGSVLNRPSDGSERPVSTIVCLKTR